MFGLTKEGLFRNFVNSGACASQLFTDVINYVLALTYKNFVAAITHFPPGANVISNTVVNYHGNLNPTISRVRILW